MSRHWRSPKDWPISLTVGPWLSSHLMRIGMATLRRSDVGRQHPEACWARGERVIVAFWHGRLLMMPFVYPGQPVAILISHHRDGEYITRIAERFGFTVVRGSTTRGGARAFKQLIHALRGGRNAVITPDGPKGPRQRAKSGVVELARLSGMPILPVAFGAWPRTILKSWDQFLVPCPFGRGVYVWGEPIYVPGNADQAAVEKFQSLLAERLDALLVEADTRAANG
ncbi:MAG: lysophospholipid acyltransferase family protein [candidate division NC10 bacterium]|nr:lysophospholipid acyltransferase family protein [candidate division NC10 bacterium]MBI2163990.1 lysophospholipid acyltransferase family protein [candidate division NC10 bacterium]MBI2458646.1 lysophospholipid acyltransferase family protein [candidate division NC10 bacterium]MBI2562622.1 lysophospholipid acyltransferase family protein [candidate division NC10 bacterium]